MMDFVISQRLAKERYEEMLEDAANHRLANAFASDTTRVSFMSLINNLVADLKFRGRDTRRATTRI